MGSRFGHAWKNIRNVLGHGALLLGLGLFCALVMMLVLEQTAKPSPLALPLQPVSAPEATVQPPVEGKLNLNTATREELMTLPGIGPHLADLIIQQRELHPFFFIEDLQAVPGIGSGRIDALRDLAYVPWPEGME